MICILYTLPSNYFQGLTNSVCNSEGSINFWREKLFFSKSGSEGINTFGREDWSFALHYNQFDKKSTIEYSQWWTNSSDVFHQFVSPIFSKNFLQFEQLKKKRKENIFFSIFVKNIVDSEFEICESIWWAHQMFDITILMINLTVI